MNIIQQWNHPYLIYQLIPLMLAMLGSVYQDIWNKLRTHQVCMLTQDRRIPGLKIFTLVCLFSAIIAVIFIFLIISVLPQTNAFISFLFVYTLEIIIILSFQASVKNYFYSKYIPEQVAHNVDNFTVKPNRMYYRILPWAYFTAIALLILATMGPEGGEKQTMLRRTPLKITVAFDLSNSMNAHDYEPSRLIAAKDEVQMLLSHSSGDEVGLVLFSDTAVIQSPPTQDIQTLLTFLNMANTETLPTHGTDLNKALEMALKTFDEEDDFYYQDTNFKTRRVVLVTDGETHTGDLNATLKRYQDRRVHVDVLAIGTENGAEILDKSGTPLQYQHETVITRLQTEILQQIAKETDGSFVKCTTPEMAARYLINLWDAIRIDTKPRGVISSLYRVQLYRIFLYPAYIILVLLLIYPMIISIVHHFQKTNNKPVHHQNDNNHHPKAVHE